MKKVLLTLVMVLVVAGAVTYAASDTKTINVSATVSAAARLTLGSGTLTFPNADPETVTSIPATEGGITIEAKARTGSAGAVTLMVKSDGDLMSGATDSIPIANLTWTTAGDAGFTAGTRAMTNADTSVGGWTGSGVKNWTQTFALANSWTYVTGSYSAVLTYTLTAP